jgi:hypothetical protein
MKPLRSAFVVAMLLTLSMVVPAAASNTFAWTKAKQAVLPTGAVGLPMGYLPTLTCVSAGNCEAGGSYSAANSYTEGLVLNEVSGKWTTPTTLVAPAGANTDPSMIVYGLSCGSIGNCSAVGSYQDSSLNIQAFFANEVNQKWLPAKEVTLPANAVGTGQTALVRSVVCSSAGNCSAVGGYIDDNTPTSRNVGFVLSEVGGSWHNASEISLTSSTNANPYLTMSQLACSSVGNCVAVGSYIDVNDVNQGLLVDQVNGAWSPGLTLTLPANASVYAGASVSEVACVKRSGCAVLGTFNTNTGAVEGLSATESKGKWPRAQELTMPPDAATNPHVFFYGYQGIACASVGNCSLGGQYQNSAGKIEGFLENENNGTWRAAVTLALPSGAIEAGKNGGVVAISCPRVGNCRAGAAYRDGNSNYQALVVTETNGTWHRGNLVVLPGGATQVGVDGGVYAVVCVATNACTATGSYLGSSTVYEGFILNS